MKRKIITITMTVLLMVFTATIIGSNSSAQSNQKVHKISLKKINKKWKAVDHKDHRKTQIRAKKGEKIVWVAENSDMYFQFNDLDLFGVYTTMLKKGEELELTIGPKAKKGDNYYAVFSIEDKAFVEGSSPPKIIID